MPSVRDDAFAVRRSRRFRLRSATLLVLLLTLAAGLPARAQVNDDCATATVIGGLPFTATLDTSLATSGGADPAPSCAGNDNNVWYSFTAVGDTSLEITTAGSAFDTNVSVYTGACGALTEIACNEDTPSSSTSVVIVPMDAGETVLIAVASGGVGGMLQLAARKSVSAYLKPEFVAEALLSSDVSPLGGSFGAMISATALTDKVFGFAARTEGIFARLAGVLTTIAASGDPTPSGGTFATFGSASMNQAATIAFQARIDGGPAEEGIFSYAGGVLSTVLLRGDPSPDGGTYRRFGRDVVINDDGNVAFLARTSLSGSDQLLLVFDGITTTIMAAEGDAAPCGGTIRRIGGSSPRGFDLAETGLDVVFRADAGASGDGIYTSDGVTTTTIRCDGDVTVLGGTHQTLGAQPTINGLGEVYFASTVSGAAITSALWRVVGGVETSVVADGDVLATGETVDAIPTTQTVATNGAGDVAFVAQLNGIGSGLVERPSGVPLPSSQVVEGGPCPFGGVVRSLAGELDLAISGGIGFSATCTGGTGALFVPAFGAPIPRGQVTDVTSLGVGFRFTGPSANAFAQTVFHGGRTGLYGVACPAGVCGPVGALVATGSLLPGLVGQHFDRIEGETFNGIGRDQAFTATTAGATTRDMIVRVHNGFLAVLASTNQALPGGVGNFGEFPTTDQFFGGVAAPSASNALTAFRARVNHPTATEGIFAARAGVTTTVVLDGDPAPSGDFFVDLGAPFAQKKSIVFNATTGTDSCVYAVKGPGLPIVTVACEGDAVPAPIGGTLGAFLAPASGSYTSTVFAAEVAGGSTSACLFSRKVGGPLVPLRCVDDPFVNGQFVTAIVGGTPSAGPVTERKGAEMTLAVETDVSSDPSFVATRKTKTFPLFENFATTLPVTGGVVSYNGYAPLSINKKTVAFAADLSGGSANGALVVGRLK